MVEPGSLASSSGLSISNVYQASASVGAAGEFSTTASAKGVMVHFVKTADGSLAGMALSVPGQTMAVNAESCLQASLFLTPGITVTDPASASRVLTQLRGQPSYATALAYLQANLPLATYQAVLEDATFPDLLLQCVLEYQPLDSPSRDVQVNPPTAHYRTADRFNIDLSRGDLRTTTVTIVNAGWRFVRIDRLERDAAKSVLALTTPAGINIPGTGLGLNFLGGAEAFSLGSVLTHTAGDPTETQDPHLLNLSSVPGTEYWVQGPGWMKGETLPDDKKADGSLYVPDDKAFVLLLSLFRYVFVPIADALLGDSFKPKSDIGLWINTLYETVEAIEDALLVVETVVNPSSGVVAKDVEFIAKEIFGVVRRILVKLFEDKILKEIVAEDIEDQLIDALSKVFLASRFIYVAANAGAVVKAWIDYRPSFRMLITSSGTGEVTAQ